MNYRQLLSVRLCVESWCSVETMTGRHQYIKPRLHKHVEKHDHLPEYLHPLPAFLLTLKEGSAH